MRIKDLEKINNLIYFTSETLLFLFPEVSKKNIQENLNRWVKKGEIKRIKRDFYVTKKAFEAYKNDHRFYEYLACRMKYPSYLTAEYVMRKHDLLTEATHNYTLATTKTRSVIKSEFTTFKYKSIKKDLFLGYEIKPFLDGEYYEATKAKALFDFIYFRLLFIPKEKISKINLVEELRLNLSGFSKGDYAKLVYFAKKISAPKNKKMLTVINNLKTHASNFV